MVELEERVRRVERDSASLDQRVQANATAITGLSSVPTQVVRLEGALQSLREAMSDLRREVAGIREGMDDRAKEQSEERRALKLALIGLTGVIVAALIGAITVLVAGA